MLQHVDARIVEESPGEDLSRDSRWLLRREALPHRVEQVDAGRAEAGDRGVSSLKQKGRLQKLKFGKASAHMTVTPQLESTSRARTLRR
jgi:hypothetical protein